MAIRREIRNSTAEFLIFQAEAKEQGVEVIYADETIWCTQKAMAALFDVGVPAISKHLANVFETGELSEEATISKMETVQHEGNRDVKRMVVMYKLDAIIAEYDRYQVPVISLFDVNVPAISKHLKNIFESGELKDDSVVSKMEITASDGKKYLTQFHCLTTQAA